MFEASFLHEGEENPERIFFREAVRLPSIIVQSFIKSKASHLAVQRCKDGEKWLVSWLWLPVAGFCANQIMLKIGAALVRIGSNYTQVSIEIGRGIKLQKHSENWKNAHIQRGLVTLHDLRRLINV